jgi:Uma2 family endonuclease
MSEKGHRWHVYGYGCPYRLRRQPDMLLCFDMSVIPEELERLTGRSSQFVDGIPCLAVEVIDLTDSHEQVSELVDVALGMGVPALWIVDPFAELIDVYRPNGVRYSATVGDEITAEPLLPGFRCRVADIFG